MTDFEETGYRWTVKYGHVKVRSWIEYRDGKLIGMGSKVEYDANGNLVAYSEVETGLVAIDGNPV